jgi:hypothetical protein
MKNINKINILTKNLEERSLTTDILKNKLTKMISDIKIRSNKKSDINNK